jgi:HTH-type transcriptional regulator/antitoxin HigA
MSSQNPPVAQAFPPGDFIREELEARGWTQSDLAKIIGRPLQVVNPIINGKKEITPETAVSLGAAFRTSAVYWLNLEAAYRLSKVGGPDPEIETRVRELELAHG